MCPSVSPGITVRPPRSINFAVSPASFFIAADVPDASTRPWPIASASWTEKSLSTVRILPLNRTVSAVWAEATPTWEAKQKAAIRARLPTIIPLAWLPEPDMSPLPYMFCLGCFAVRLRGLSGVCQTGCHSNPGVCEIPHRSPDNLDTPVDLSTSQRDDGAKRVGD